MVVEDAGRKFNWLLFLLANVSSTTLFFAPNERILSKNEMSQQNCVLLSYS